MAGLTTRPRHRSSAGPATRASTERWRHRLRPMEVAAHGLDPAPRTLRQRPPIGARPRPARATPARPPLSRSEAPHAGPRPGRFRTLDRRSAPAVEALVPAQSSDVDRNEVLMQPPQVDGRSTRDGRRDLAARGFHRSTVDEVEPGSPMTRPCNLEVPRHRRRKLSIGDRAFGGAPPPRDGEQRCGAAIRRELVVRRGIKSLQRHLLPRAVAALLEGLRDGSGKRRRVSAAPPGPFRDRARQPESFDEADLGLAEARLEPAGPRRHRMDLVA